MDEPMIDTVLQHKLKFRHLSSESASLKLWFYVAAFNETFFPWWNFDASIEDDIKSLSDVWSIKSPENLFDFLFLHSLQKLAAPNLYVIFPGNIRQESWNETKETERQTFLKGQGCIYHLQGVFSEKLSIQWVPFWQPQSLVKNPSPFSMWQLFQRIPSDDQARSLSFFSLSDPGHLPAVINLLIEPAQKRSEDLASHVDWFGMYSSPVQALARTGCVIYSQSNQMLEKFSSMENILHEQYIRIFESLASQRVPNTAYKIMSGLTSI